MNYHTARVCHIYFTLYFFLHELKSSTYYTVFCTPRGSMRFVHKFDYFLHIVVRSMRASQLEMFLPFKTNVWINLFFKGCTLTSPCRSWMNPHKWADFKMLANRVVRTFVSLLVQTVVTAFMFWCEESFAVVKLGNLCSKWLCSKWKMADQIKLLCLLSEVSFPQECLACWVVSGCLVA